ncbi:MAG: Ig-like domain-containing protein, partial [Lachnospiraceae bacterium]|nr:Ig-like domain-containing protein [Lachnospiraceae bacterium]
DTDNLYSWVHNCDIFYGSTGGDSDQAKGDGTIDVKGNSQYQTYSYNHFWDSGKASLCGMKSESGENFITYHHNWFDHSDSRHPRVRTMSVHSYNNFYDGISKYGAGAAYRSSIFMDSNYFRNCQYPMLSSMQGSDIYAGGTTSSKEHATFSSEDGGIIKAYGNLFEGSNITVIPYACENYIRKGVTVPYDLDAASTEQFDAYFVAERSTTVPSTVAAYQGGSTYTNFDTNEDLGVEKGDIDAAADVPAQVMAHAGRVQGGDLRWDFGADAAGETTAADVSYAVDSALKSLVVNYKTALVSIGGFASTVVSSSISDPFYARVIGDKDAAANRYNAAGIAARTTYEAESSAGKTVTIYTPVEGYEFVSSEFLTSQSADTTTDSHVIADSVDYGNFSLIKPKTIKGKTDRISLYKSSAAENCGTFTVKDVPADSVIRFVLCSDGKEADGTLRTSYYEIADSSGTSVLKGDLSGSSDTTVVTKKITAGGDFTLKYDADHLSETFNIRIVSATVCTVSTSGGGSDPVVDDTDYAVTLNAGDGVTVSTTPSATYKKGATVSFVATVDDADNYDMSVVIKRASGTQVSYKKTDNTYSFTMPASAVTITLTASAKTPEEEEIVYHDVSFDVDGVITMVQVEDGKTVSSSDIPDVSDIDGFQCWSLGTTTDDAVDPASYTITEDVTFTAVIKEYVYTYSAEFQAASYLSEIGAFSNAEKYGAAISSGLSTAYIAQDDDNPLVYGPFTFNDWKIPSKNKNTIGIRYEKDSTGTVSTNGMLTVEVPDGAAVLYISGRTGKSSGVAHFKLTGPDGRSYTAENSAGKENQIAGGGTQTISYKLGVAGTYKLEYDLDAQAADSNASELRFYEVSLTASVDERADPYNVVTFVNGDKTLAAIKKERGDFIDRADIPSVSLTADETLLGWSATGDEADVVTIDEIMDINVMADTTYYAIKESTGDDVTKYTVTYYINETTGYTETVIDGNTLANVPSINAPAGKEFKGWSETENGTVYIDTTTWKPTADTTLYAVYADYTPAPTAWVYDFTETGTTTANNTKIWNLNTGKVTGTTSLFALEGNASTGEYKKVTGSAEISGITFGPYGDTSTKKKFLQVTSSKGITFVTEKDGCTLYIFTINGEDERKVKVDGTVVEPVSGLATTTVNSGTHTILKGASKDAHVAAVILTYVPETTTADLDVTYDDTKISTSLSANVTSFYKDTEITFNAEVKEGYKNLVVKKTVEGGSEETMTPDETTGLYSLTLSANTAVTMTVDVDTSTYVKIGLEAEGLYTDFIPGKYEAGSDITFNTYLSSGYDQNSAVVQITKKDKSAVVYEKNSSTGQTTYKFSVPDQDVTINIKATKLVPESISVHEKNCEETASSMEIYEGESVALVADISPAGVTDAESWTSSAETVATVSRGLITGVSKGTAVITVSVGSGENVKTATVNLTVKEVVPTAVVIKKDGTDVGDSISLYKDGTVTLTAAVEPVLAKYKSVEWASTNTSAVTVENGIVSAVGIGESEVSVTVTDNNEGTVTDKVTVKVTELIPTGIILKDSSGSDQTGKTISLEPNGTVTITATKQPADASGSIVWSSSNPSVATVNGGVITAVSAGKAVITATIDPDSLSTELTDTIKAELTVVVSKQEESTSEIYVEYRDDGYTYTGSKITPAFEVYDGEYRLIKGRDYAVSFKNNVNAYTISEDDKDFDSKLAPQLTVKLKGLYSGSHVEYFTISPIELEDGEITSAEVKPVAYKAGKSYAPAPKVIYNGKALKKNKDYTLKYYKDGDTSTALDKCADAGKYQIYAEFIGNYDGSAKVADFVIYDSSSVVPVNKLKISLDKKAVSYKASGITVGPEDTNDIILSVKSGSNDVDREAYTVTVENGAAVGKASAVVTFDVNEGYAGTKVLTFNITGTDLKTLKIMGSDGSSDWTPSDLTYTGENLSQNGSFKVMDGETELTGSIYLDKEDADYFISYSEIRNAGKVKMTFTGNPLRGYSGKVVKNYKILPIDLSAKDSEGNDQVAVANEDSLETEYVKAGAQIIPELTYNDETLLDGADFKVTYKNNKAVAARDAAKAPEMTIKGKGNYTGSRVVKYTITAADLSSSVFIAAPDIVCKENKNNNWKQNVTVYDRSGKKLAKQDYTATFYEYDSDSNTLGSEIADKAVMAQGSYVAVKITAGTSGLYALPEGSDAPVAVYRLMADKSSVKNIAKGKFAVNPQEFTNSEITLEQDDFKSRAFAGTDVALVDADSDSDGFKILGYYNNVRENSGAIAIVQGSGAYSGTKVLKFKIGKRTAETWWKTGGNN